MSKQYRDPAIGLDCYETPFHPPNTISISDLAECESCSLVISAIANGGKDIYDTKTTSKGIGYGIGFNESPLVSLKYNGKLFNLVQSIIWPSGAHYGFKAMNPYDLEINLYFRDNYSNEYAVAIPIMIDESKAKPYFNEIGSQDTHKYSLETIIDTSSPVLMYKGSDLRNRNYKYPADSSNCSSSSYSITWFVLPPTYISRLNADRLRNTDILGNINPPAPSKPLDAERIRHMCMSIPTIQIQSQLDAEKKKQDKTKDNGIYLTRALQCQRIDPVKDVKGDAVYLKNTDMSSLQDELETAADSSNLDHADISGYKSPIRAKRIEDILTIIVGIIIALVVFGLITYFLLKLMYGDYSRKVAVMESSAEVYLTAKKKACEQFVGKIA